MKHLLTLLFGFVLGGIVAIGSGFVLMHQRPATPKFGPATAIKVRLYPCEWAGRIDGAPVNIPPEKLDLAFRLLTPETYFGGGVHDFITPIVAKAVITHADGTETYLLIRDHGHNPAVVTVDGRNYFYARNDADVNAGAIQLIQLVNEVADKEKAMRQLKP